MRTVVVLVFRLNKCLFCHQIALINKQRRNLLRRTISLQLVQQMLGPRVSFKKLRSLKTIRFKSKQRKINLMRTRDSLMQKKKNLRRTKKYRRTTFLKNQENPKPILLNRCQYRTKSTDQVLAPSKISKLPCFLYLQR